jgi:hypothetical protein
MRIEAINASAHFFAPFSQKEPASNRRQSPYFFSFIFLQSVSNKGPQSNDVEDGRRS